MIYLLLDIARDWLIRTGVYPVVSVLDQIHFRMLAAVALSFVLVVAFGRRTIAGLARLKIGDSGLTDADALRAVSAGKARTPTMGGILIAGSVAASVVLLSDLRNYYVLLGLVVVVWLAALGGVDDWLKLTASRRGAGSRQGLYAWEKLVFQVGLGLLVGYFAYRKGDTGAALNLAHALNLPFQKSFDPQLNFAPSAAVIVLPLWGFVTLAVLMVAGLSNAVNITDGMDGLAGGVSAAVCLGLCVLSLVAGTQVWAQYLLVPYVPGSDELALLSGATLGASLGFLWWNCSPAQVFMGDTGSLCLGGVVAYVAVVTRQEAVVLLMSGVFLVEIASVVIQVGCFKATRRISGTGRRVFRVAPLHHDLHLRGWPEPRIVSRAWIVSILLVVAALASLKVR